MTLICLLWFTSCLSDCVHAEELETEREVRSQTEEGSGETEEAPAGEEELQKLQEQVWDSLLSRLEFTEVEEMVKKALPREKVTFYQVFSALVNGDGGEELREVFLEFGSDALFYTLKANRAVMAQLLALVIAAAVFSNFASVFQSRQTAQMGFYLVYLLLITSCLQAFRVTVESVQGSLEQLTDFMQVLSPAYFLSMAFATGSVSAVAFYQAALLVIYLVELVILRVLLPMIRVYLLLQTLNFLTEEAYLSKLTELLETVVGWSLKALLALVTGVSLIRGTLGPALDTVKRSGLTKGAEMIPGLGDVLGGTAEIILSTAVLIKNGVGMAGAVLAAAICLPPLLNMTLLTLLYRGMAALIQPISDKRITDMVNSVGLGCQLLLRVVFTTGILFLLTIGVAAALTS